MTVERGIMTETEGFKVFDFSISQPYFTVTENGITFSKGVAQHLGFPRFAQLSEPYERRTDE